MKHTDSCWMCGKVAKKNAWGILLYRRKKPIGRYCTKTCAQDDSWGPKFIKSRPVRIPQE